MSKNPITASTDINVHDLHRFFEKLRTAANHYYSLLQAAPKTVFRIVQESEPECIHSLKEFLENSAQFDSRRDTFRVYFDVYYFRDEWDACAPYWDLLDNPFDGHERYEICKPEAFSVADFIKEYPHMLAFWCREAILSNKPLRFDDGTIRLNDPSQKETNLLSELVGRCNERIIADLRTQYESLKAIDCLHG